MKNTSVEIKIQIFVGSLDNKSLGLKVYDQDHLIYQHKETDLETVRIEHRTQLPADLTFQVYGKGRHDTKIDQSGQILADKFLRVDALCVNGIWLKKWALESRIFQFQSDQGQSHTSNYWGFNGRAKLNLPADLLEFWLDLLTISEIDH